MFAGAFVVRWLRHGLELVDADPTVLHTAVLTASTIQSEPATRTRKGERTGRYRERIAIKQGGCGNERSRQGPK